MRRFPLEWIYQYLGAASHGLICMIDTTIMFYMLLSSHLLVAQIGEAMWATVSEQMLWLGYSRDAAQCEQRWYEIQVAASASGGSSDPVVVVSTPVEF